MSEITITPLGTISPYTKGNMNCPGVLINYNNKKNDKGYLVNEKGSRLRGFLFSTSKKFRLKSEKDGYDFQLSAYKYIL